MEAILRHTCTLCGGCCQGFAVPLHDEGERQNVMQAALRLGVEDPIDGATIRRTEGRCVFLAEDDRCQIHAALGPDAKPVPCRQFPLVAIHAEDGLRIQVDPGSYGAWRSWHRGEPLPDTRIVATRPPCPGGLIGAETALIAECQGSLDDFVGALVRQPAGAGSGFQRRAAQHLAGMDLRPFLEQPGIGRRLRGALRPLVEAAPGWKHGPPETVVDPELDTWMVESIRRMLWLRLLPEIPRPPVAALLLSLGGLAARWVPASREVRADVWSGWLRGLRFSPMWRAVAGDTARRATLLGSPGRP